MSYDRRIQEIRNRQKEIEVTIDSLVSERKKLAKEVEVLRKEKSFKALLQPLLKTQNEWSATRPRIVFKTRHNGHGVGTAFVNGDLCINSFFVPARGSKKCVLTVTISNGWRCVFKTQKTYNTTQEMTEGVSELYYKTVLKALNKLVNRTEQ